MNSRELLLYIDIANSPTFVGTVFVSALKGRESYAFEYDKNFLKQNMSSVSLDPSIGPFTGRQFTDGIFGFLSDSAPDRWGRLLMNRRERIQADTEGRKPRKLMESDYILGVFDATRMGGLRFKTEPSGPFLSDDQETPAPPWTSLRSLEEASRNFEMDENPLSDKWLGQLIKPGSSLGGARPKATVSDPSGNLWIAKFPSRNDDFNIGAWEMVAHDLAEKCSLNVPEARLEKFSQMGSTFLVKRFDRNGERRIHFSSAMTLLNKKDGASAEDGTSYLDIASFIKSKSIQPKKDLNELWKRIVFSMAISNTDDHLRNHAFIYSSPGWKLSPLFDVNPTPYGNELSLNVDMWDNSIDLDLALSVSEGFNLSLDEARDEAKSIVSTVKSNWKILAARYGISTNEMEMMEPAFSIHSSL